MIIFIGAAIPTFACMVYVLRLGPLPFLDTTPMAFTITGAAIVWGMMRYNLFNLIPVVNQRIIDCIVDGVMVLDDMGRVVEMNPAAERLLGRIKRKTIGKQADDVLPAWLLENYLTLTDDTEIVRRATLPGEPSSVYEIRVSLLRSYTDTVVGRLVLIRDDTERHRLESRLQTLAYYDTLTGLPNRALFVDRLEQALVRGRRNHTDTSVIFLDLDYFKDINDTLGHSIGDAVLQQVARRLISCVRSSDTVARLGGDEFVVILPDLLPTEDPVNAANRILEAFVDPMLIGDTFRRITPSLGITIAPLDGNTVEQLMQHADQAMYRAKRLGRNMYCT